MAILGDILRQMPGRDGRAAACGGAGRRDGRAAIPSVAQAPDDPAEAGEG